MKTIKPLILALSLALTAGSLASAQDATAPSMPKVLLIQREWLKPGKAGAIHDKSEQAFIQAMNKYKIPDHYIALNSMTGKSRALFLEPYESFAAYEKSGHIFDTNPAFAADLDHALASDGELQDSYDQAFFTYDEDLSYKPKPDISHARYIEFTIFHLKPGHRSDFEQATKMVKAAYEKAGTSAHWAMYEIAYGGESDTFIAIASDTSLADIDKGMMEGKQWLDAMGEDGMKKLGELAAAGFVSMGTELFSINPKQSYPPEAFVKADPAFWKPKKAAAKPAPKAPVAAPAKQ